MAPFAFLLFLLLLPFWMWWLWRRMKKVQAQANERARRPERKNIAPIEDVVGRADGLSNVKSTRFDDDLDEADRMAGIDDPLKDLEGRRH